MAQALEDKDVVIPQWVQDIENRIQEQFRRPRLGHEIGAGAKCLTCKEGCPGLELHFWRKKCKNCKCGREVHDIADEDDLRFQILFKNKENSTKYLAAKAVLDIKVKEKLHKNVVVQQFSESSDVVKPMKFDWVPPEASPSLAADYMNDLPCDKIPISGSVGAEYRKIQKQRQIPIHDLWPARRYSAEEKKQYDEYIGKLCANAGIGKILRVKQISRVEESTPYAMQPAQSTGVIKRSHHDIQDLTNGVKNINICPAFNATPPVFMPRPGFKPPPGFNPVPPIFRFGSEASPRSTMRNLPQTIPGSMLRLPSSFKTKQISFENQPKNNLNNESVMSCNNNVESTIDTSLPGSFVTDNEGSSESVDITGISPLAESPTDETENEGKKTFENRKTSEPTPVGTSTPFDKIDILDPVTTSNVAQSLNNSNSSSFRNQSDKNNQDLMIVASDLENHNTQAAGGACAPSETPAEVHMVEMQITCFECRRMIEFNTIAVFVEKAGRKAWHPKCFVCAICKELLVDLTYFHHRGEVYCARHYGRRLNYERCYACDELIYDKQSTKADGYHYHIQHFCCVECDVKLADMDYMLNEMNDNHPTCLECFDKIYAKPCKTCDTPIRAGQQGIKYKGECWHSVAECFKCTYKGCQRPLVNLKLAMFEKMPYCSKVCYHKALDQEQVV